MLFKWFSRLYHTTVLIVFFEMFIQIFAPILVEASPIPNVFINEIHYDNLGKDQNEFIEIAGYADLDLSGWSLHLYNGSNGREYNSFNFDNWSYIDSETNFGFISIKAVGIQNGSPDGIVLYDGSNIIQFLSYEGVFTANTGIAADLTSVDIGVLEHSDTPLGLSLQLSGTGEKYSDFTWLGLQNSTFGGVNLKQIFMAEKHTVVSVNEPSSLLLLNLALILFTLRVFKTKPIKQFSA